jgi:hypothetical protein
MSNNALLRNAAAQAVMTAAMAGADPVSVPSGLITQAEAIGLQIDTAIANDNTISQGSGAPILGSAATAAQICNQQAKTQLIAQAVYSVLVGKTAVASLDAATVTAIVAWYTASVASINVT